MASLLEVGESRRAQKKKKKKKNTQSHREKIEREEGRMASEKRVVTLAIRSFDDLVQIAVSSNEIIQIDLPINIKIPEYKKIVELADKRGYKIVNEKEKLKIMMQRRKKEMKKIDNTIEELQRMVDRLDRKMKFHS